MTTGIKKVDCYRTSDGQTFDTLALARSHQDALTLRERLGVVYPHLPTAVVAWLTNVAPHLYTLLWQHYEGAEPQPFEDEQARKFRGLVLGGTSIDRRA